MRERERERERERVAYLWTKVALVVASTQFSRVARFAWHRVRGSRQYLININIV